MSCDHVTLMLIDVLICFETLKLYRFSMFQHVSALFGDIVESEVRANAETPADARQAKEFGAEGIGLVRTEHMFFEGQRIVAMRQMILATDEADRRQALDKLLVMQREDITELF